MSMTMWVNGWCEKQKKGDVLVVVVVVVVCL